MEISFRHMLFVHQTNHFPEKKQSFGFTILFSRKSKLHLERCSATWEVFNQLDKRRLMIQRLCHQGDLVLQTSRNLKKNVSAQFCSQLYILFLNLLHSYTWFLVTNRQSWLCNKYSPAENCSKEVFFLLMCTLFNSV